jgi:hypothetical protein
MQNHNHPKSTHQSYITGFISILSSEMTLILGFLEFIIEKD